MLPVRAEEGAYTHYTDPPRNAPKMVQCDFISKINFSKEVERTTDTTLQSLPDFRRISKFSVFNTTEEI